MSTPSEPSTLDLPGQADDDGWRRLHKVTPLLRGWQVVAIALVLVVQQGGDQLIGGNGVPGRFEVLVTLGVLVAVVLVAAIWSVVSWRMMRYRVQEDSLQFHSGVLFRQQRQARLDRLQGVDVVQPLLGRFFGLSELKLEVAGGSGSDVKLAYLRDDDAQRLRNVLLARAAGLSYEGEDAPQAPEHPVAEVPPGRLVGSMLRSASSVMATVAVVAAIVASFFEPRAGLALVPAVLGGASALWTQFSRGFNFRVATSPDGLRLRHGLLEARAQTVPPGRVQAISLTQPLLWRGPDWWRLRVNIAGYGGTSDEGQGGTVLMPVATRGEAFAVLSLVMPDLGHDEPARLLAAGMTGRTPAGTVVGSDSSGSDAPRDDVGFIGAPRRSRWLDPIGWRRHGFIATDRILLLRSGLLQRHLVLVPHERTQSLGMNQGPVQRSLRLASVLAHSTQGPVSPRIDHLDQDVASMLLTEQASRARLARASSGPERWMEKPGHDVDHGG